VVTEKMENLYASLHEQLKLPLCTYVKAIMSKIQQIKESVTSPDQSCSM